MVICGSFSFNSFWTSFGFINDMYFNPDFLLNLIIGKFCWVILTLVRKYAHPKKMIGSEYERRIAGNSEVYNEMRRRLEESLTSENIQNNVTKYCNERQQEVLKSLKPVHL